MNLVCECGEALRVTHTYRVNEETRTQAATCDVCHSVYTLVSVTQILGPAEYGTGAHALAKKLKKSRYAPKINGV